MSMLILIFLVLVALFVVGGFIFNKFRESFTFGENVLTLAGLAFMLFAGIGFVALAMNIRAWVGSEYKAAIINREYKTNYTREEIFFASDVIDTIRELDRKRIELNGNLMGNDTDNEKRIKEAKSVVRESDDA